MQSYIQSKLRPLPSSSTTQGLQNSVTAFNISLHVIVIDILSLFIPLTLIGHIILFYTLITFKLK